MPRGLIKWRSGSTGLHNRPFAAGRFAASRNWSRKSTNTFNLQTTTRSLSSGPPPRIRSSLKFNDYVNVFPGQHTRSNGKLARRGAKTLFQLRELVARPQPPYPNQIFTILIWGSDRDKFGNPETKFQNKRVCVTGVIKDYRGNPEIVADQPNQLQLQKTRNA